MGVYYNNELQDFRADPASIAKDFPLQLYLKESGRMKILIVDDEPGLAVGLAAWLEESGWGHLAWLPPVTRRSNGLTVTEMSMSWFAMS